MTDIQQFVAVVLLCFISFCMGYSVRKDAE